ncbi:MAG: peptidase domain-containing ABC transporter [Pleurocapsa sp.]
MNSELYSQPSFSHSLQEKILQTLGSELSPQELQLCLQAVKILEPKPSKQFWQSSESLAGIYTVLAGKARLLDCQNNFLVSLEAGESFGELTLFPQATLQPYVARASFQLQLAYLPGKLLQEIAGQNPRIGQRLYHQAVQLDLLLLCRQNHRFKDVSVPQLKKIISLLESHNLSVGVLPDSLREKVLWLVKTGELVSSQQTLNSDRLYWLDAQLRQQDWRIARPTQLYSLSQENWQQIVSSIPQLDTKLASPKQLLVTPRENTNFPKLVRVQDQSSSSPPRQPLFPSPTQRVGHWWQKLVRRYPFYAQQSASDCGAACLVMVGRYWQKKFNLHRLRELAAVNRSGSSLKGLVTAAETMGFNTKPVKATLSQLAQQKLPAIVHWEGNHYIVVYEIRKDRVVVADPAVGQKTLSKREFLEGWTGYALLLEPTTSLKSDRTSSGLLWQFWELLKPHRVVISEVFVASVLIQLFGLITPLLTQIILDRVVVQRSSVTLTAIGLGLLIFGLFRVVMTGLRQYLLDHTAQRIDAALIVGFIRHTFRLPLSFFESRYVGDIMARVQENDKIQRFLTGEALSIILDILTVFVYIGLMFWYSWQMALLALAIIPPFLFLALIATPFLQKISREIFGAMAKESSYLIEALTGVNTIKSMAVEQQVRWHWEELLNNSIKTSFRGQVIGNKLQVFSSIIEVVATTAVLWLGAWQVINNQLTIGQLVAFNMLLANVISPFQRLTVLWNQLQEVIIAVERINDVLDAKPEEELEKQQRQIIGSIQGHIALENVTFRYHPDSDRNILENLNFEIQPGQTIALVGRSGSGKSTLAKLILGLYVPTEGRILIDGHDLTTISLRSLRSQIGVVDQSNFLFGGTIRENISISHPEASIEAITEAATQAGANEFIEKLPLGYDTPIGERGGTLSGGQCQRLAIARALLGNPRLLILDEATSNLDAESERIIQNNLSTIVKGRTNIIIAHRLSTIRHADLILVLDQGIIIESGTHQDLMRKRGHYFYLNQQQLAINH